MMHVKIVICSLVVGEHSHSHQDWSAALQGYDDDQRRTASGHVSYQDE
jgi:hypothetical protein